MNTKRFAMLTLVFALMISMVAAVSAQDETDGRQGKRVGPRLGNSTIITDATGLTRQEIHDAVRNDGATVADLIEANGGNVETVIDALVAEATTRVTERVELGQITQVRADSILESLEERITARINGTFERPEDGHRRGPRGRFGGNNADDTTTDTP